MSSPKNINVLIILIDDDDINNMISRLTIQKIWRDTDIVTFSSSVEALEYLQTDFPEKVEAAQEVIILLNINMPRMTGWEFMDRFEGFADEVKVRHNVYILSSSIDLRDEEKSRNNKYVIEFLPKPLTTEMVLRLRARVGKQSDSQIE